MAQKAEIVHAVPHLAEAPVKFRHRAGDPAEALLDGGAGGEVPLQVGQERGPLLFLLGAQQGPQQVIELVGLQLRGGIGQQLPRQAAPGGQLLQEGAEARLGRAGEIGVGRQLLVEQIGLVDGRLLPQGHEGDRHIGGKGHVKSGVEQVGLPLAVAAGEEHPLGAPRLPHRVHALAHPAQHPRPGLGEIFPHRPGGHAGAQRLDHMQGVEIRHGLRLPPPRSD